MKYVVFLCAVAAIFPAAQWLRRNPAWTYRAWILFGFLPFAYNPHIALIDWAGWPGYVKGVLMTGVDLLALTLFLNMPKTERPAPFRATMVLYFAAVVFSISQAQVWMAAAFYPWQLLKTYFIYVVVRRASRDERVLEAILIGMTLAVCFEVVVAGWQRIGHGVVRAEGSFGDKNLLGFIAEFAIFTPLALLLAGRRGWYITAAPLAGVLIAILTVSRAALGFGATGFVLIFVLSGLRRWTARKAKVLGACAVILLVAAPIAWTSVQERFAVEPQAGGDERAMFNESASMILADHPFGIGANNYVIVSNGQGYKDRAGIPWTSSMAIIHNVYWLTAAETGYFGLIAFVLLYFQITMTALRCGWKYTRDIRGDMLLGLGVTLLVVALHNAYEWIFLVGDVQYLFGIIAGLIAGLAEQLGYWGTRRRVVNEPSYVVSRPETRHAPAEYRPPLGRL